MMLTDNQDKFFILYSNCIPVKGYNRSIILDLQRESYIYIPNSLFELIGHFRSMKIGEILRNNSELADSVLNEYLAYLLEFEMGMFVETPDEFPMIDTTYNLPFQVFDSIIEISDVTLASIVKIYNELTILGCQFLELRSYTQLSLDTIELLSKLVANTRLRNVNIQIKYDKNISESELVDVLRKYQIIGKLIVHSSPYDRKFECYEKSRLVYVKQQIFDNSQCGADVNKYKMINLQFYNESLKYNNCLNNKVSVDKDGNICNCPTLNTFYGNVLKDSIVDIVQTNEFHKLGKIGKDQISVCRDCEYRYCCSDCRAHVSSPTEKPINCNYNPYTNEYR